MNEEKTKFCKHCGEKIDEDAVLCIKCGKQVEEIKNGEGIVINNSASAVAQATATAINEGGFNNYREVEKNKWVALALCVFTIFGHKFYEGKIGMGVLYLFTVGLFGIGWIVDIITLIFKPNPYIVQIKG